MPKRGPKPDHGIVWSSEAGDLRRAGPEPTGSRAVNPPAPSGSGCGGGRVKVRRETAGRRGKAVTTVSGLPLDDAALRALAGRLKKRCGVGGSAKDGVIEIQGDHRAVVVDELRAAGYDVVLAGG